MLEWPARSLQFLEADVLELDFHRRAGMHLEGDDAAGGRLSGVMVSDLAHAPTIAGRVRLEDDEELSFHPPPFT